MLQIEGLTRRFGSTLAVNDVSVEITSGEFVAVVGRSGAGKSTLLRLINRLIEPSGGRVAFCGRDICALRGRELRAWRAQAAMIFQGFNLSPRLDVLTNVLVGASMEIPQMRRLFRLYTRPERHRAAAALDDLGLLEKALERAERLSGGQQQRVAIARALMQHPKLILADEPIASLDPHNAHLVMETLRGINREHGIPILCNLHSLEFARAYADRALGLRDGRLVFDGPISALTDETATRIYGGAVEPDDRSGLPFAA